MSLIIESGDINPYKMVVDRFGRARVFSTSTTQEHHAATVVAEAFELSTVNNEASPYAQQSIADSSNGIVMSVQNQNASKTMSLQKITFASDAEGLVVTLVKNAVRGTLANNTTTSAVAGLPPKQVLLGLLEVRL
jgi:predicted Fe-Mo cluster-binding NifX family protein